MEIATPARSSPFPKLTFDHKLLIAKHLVSSNGDDKRKTPNHLNGEDECSASCDLKEDANYECGAKSRLIESNVTGGIVISNDKTPNSVGDRPILGVQRQDDMPSKMSENHSHLQLNDNLQSSGMMMRINDDEMCNNINRENTTTTTTTNPNTITTKISYDAPKCLDERIKSIPISVSIYEGADELLKSNQLNCNINKSDLRNNDNQHDYNENCKNDTNCNGIFNNNNDGQISSLGNGIGFKVPTELAISNINSSNTHNNNRSSPSSPSIPYRKQSVFVAPAGLNWIIHKNRNNPQHQQQQSSQQQQLTLKQNSTDSSVPSTIFSSKSSPIVSTLPFNSSPSLPPTASSSSSSSSSTILSSSIGANGEIYSNNSSSSSTVNNSNSSANNSSTFIRKNSTSLQPNANAQEIEQHISKIISENAAIVETLDPLWSKRFLSRHSVSSLPSGSSSSSSTFSSVSSYPTNLTGSTATTNNLPSRRYSEIVVDPNHASGSKLQSALLGRVLTSSGTNVTPSNVPQVAHHHQQQHRSSTNLNGPTKKFSEPIYPSVIINMKQHQQQQANALINKTGGSVGINDQTGLRPSLVRNLLTSSKSPSTIKVIPVPTTTSTIVDNPSSNINPDNPEGSIIKDLLLKARDSSESSTERRNSRVQMPSIPPPIQEELSMLVYVCTLCNICFRNRETLEAHQLHYCKANEAQSTINNERSPNQLQLLNDHVQRKISVMESNFLQQQLTKPVQSSGSNLKSGNIFTQPQLVNQQQHHSKQHHYQSSSPSPHNQPLQQQHTVGNILKQQLLAPSAGPPQKKRKTSEPLFTKSHLHRFSHPHIPLNHHGSSQHHGDIINSQNVRKTSVVQGPSSKLLIHKSKSNNKETLIESDCLNSSLSSSSSSSSSTSSSTMINDNHVISVTSEPITFSSTNTIATQSIAFSSSNHSNSFYNQSSLDISSSPSSNQDQKVTLDILPDYYPHLKCPKTKVTLSGPIVFPVLRKILTENKENIEFQAPPEALQSTSTSSSTTNPSGHANNDSINSNYLVYKQIPSIPEFDEDSMVDEKFKDKMKLDESKYSFNVEHDDNVDEHLNTLLTDKLAQQGVPPNNQEGQDYRVDGHFKVDKDSEYDDNQDGMNELPEGSKSMDNSESKLNNITNNSNIANGLNNNRPTTLTLRRNSCLTLSSSSGLIHATTSILGDDNKLIGSTLVSPDTPRPKRKCMQLYIKGQTYTYLGLKMSTRSTYCCIYRPQPMYVPQEASSKLSMYSNWKINPPHHDIFKLMSPAELLHAYDTRQWCFKTNGISITFAPSLESKKSIADSFILTPSAYWINKKQPEEKAAIKRELMEYKRKGIEEFTDAIMDNNNNHSHKSFYLSGGGSRKTSEDRLSAVSGFDSDSNDPNQPKRVKIFEGGFKSNEDYTYVRGRGRGKYVCEECGIRCKKPSMLKKHIRTHTDLRPYSCRHCAFAFKTKGNLTKHMKSKAHHKKCVELGIIPVPITIDDSQIDCEALAKQEALERSYSGGNLASDDDENDDEDGCEEEDDDGSDDEGVPIPIITSSGNSDDRGKMDIDEQEVARSLLVLSGSGEWSVQGGGGGGGENPTVVAAATASGLAPNCLEANYNCDNRLVPSPSKQQVHTQVQHHYQHLPDAPSDLRKLSTSSSSSLPLNKSLLDDRLSQPSTSSSSLSSIGSSSSAGGAPVHVNGGHFVGHWAPNLHNSRQRSFSFNDGLIRRNVLMNPNLEHLRRFEKIQPTNFDLRNCKSDNNNQPINGHINGGMSNEKACEGPSPMFEHITTDDSNDSEVEDHFQRRYSMSVIQDRVEQMNFNCDVPIDLSRRPNGDPVAGPSRHDYHPPGRRNTLSTPSSHPLRHLSRAELAAALGGSAAASFGIAIREDGKAVCLKCNKSFPKLSQLRLHVNVHYFERPFRCDSCGVSFRTKGHLQKHEKSVTHSDKVKINLAFGTATSDNPRPFKCDDCIIAFRIHGHLAKHLRSKNHIMKLECAGKLPCGMYADMERFGVNLNNIETADCETSLMSLQRLANQMYNSNGEVNLAWVRHITVTAPTSNGNTNQNDPNTVTVTTATIMTNQNATNQTTTTSSPSSIATSAPIEVLNHSPDTIPSIPSTSTTTITTINENIYYHNLKLTNCNTMDVDSVHDEDTDCNNIKPIDNDPNKMVEDNNNNHYAYHNHVGQLDNMHTANTLQVPSPPPPQQPPSAIPPSINSHPTSSTPPSTSTTTTTSSTTNITSIRSNTCNYCKQVFKSAKFLQVHLYCDHQQRSSSPSLTTDPQPQHQHHQQPQPVPPSLTPALPPQPSTSSIQIQQPQPQFQPQQPIQIHPHQLIQSQYPHLQPQFHHPFHHELHQQHLQHLQQLQQLQQQIHPHHLHQQQQHHHHQQQQRPETPSDTDN